MQAYEFESSLEHGMIKAPEELHRAEGQTVRVIVLLDESMPAPQNAIQNLIDNPIPVDSAKPLKRDVMYAR